VSDQKKSSLTDKEQSFCEQYIVDLNATQAAIRAGYSENSAAAIGYENLRKPHIQAEIDRLKLERCERTRVTADRVVLELARIAFSSMKDLATWNENGMCFRDSEDIDEDAAAAISEIESRKVVDKDENEILTLKIKRHDKVAALKELREHTKLSGTGLKGKGTLTLAYNFNDEGDDEESGDAA
jgi:phage terminase small subunit